MKHLNATPSASRTLRLLATLSLFALFGCADQPPLCRPPPPELTRPGPKDFRKRLDKILKEGQASLPERTLGKNSMHLQTRLTNAPFKETHS